jgi:transcriptional regulator with XRE-family HTH domain
MEKELQELKELHRFYLYHDYKTGEIARELGVSTRTVQRWFSGKARPTQKKLKEIRKLLTKKRRKF